MRDSHCPHCGTLWTPVRTTQTCVACGETTWRNPLPVAVLVVPATLDGVAGALGVIRADQPDDNALALPGGFCEVGESWQESAVREVLEETGAIIDASCVASLATSSVPGGGTLLVFGYAKCAPVDLSRLRVPLTAAAEVSGLTLLTDDTALCFSLHSQALATWFRLPH